MKTIDESLRGRSLSGRKIPQRYRVDVLLGAVKGGQTYPRRRGYVVRVRYFYPDLSDAQRYASMLRDELVSWRIFDRAARRWLTPRNVGGAR